MPTDDPVEPVLRVAYGQVLARLLREFGAQRLAVIEDGVSQAMLEAMLSWRSRGVPEHAAAWLHRAARHRVIDELRRGAHVTELVTEGDDDSATVDAPEGALRSEVGDDELSALIACAAPGIPLASQMAFALRTLCGFSTAEVAARLMTSEENVQKRLERARESLRDIDLNAELPAGERPARLESLLRMLYVLFTEGYFSSGGEVVLRLELCREALRLTHLVCHHPTWSTPDAWALLALMHLHHARRDARTDELGLPVQLEHQNRTLYRRDELAAALEAFQLARAAGATGSKYFLEAAIAAEHAFAPRFEDIRWGSIVALYAQLEQLEPASLHALHRVIASSWAVGPRHALTELDAITVPPGGEFLLLATRADLLRRSGELQQAVPFYERAIALAPPVERRVLERTLADCR